MRTKEPHITTAYIALICSVLGWVSWGVIAIPGVIIAHTIKSDDPSTAVTIKAALRVGYSSILIGLAALTTVAFAYLGFLSRLKVALGLSEATHFNDLQAQPTFFRSPDSNQVIANWAWMGGIFLVTVVSFILLLPLIRKGYASLQSARIIRSNTSR